jgi:hypothetical protein
MAFKPASIVRIAIANDYVAHRARVGPRPWHWTEIVAIPVAAISMLTFALAIAAEPWVRDCNPAAIGPIALASLLLLIAADLLFAPRRAWSRSRDNAAMNTVSIAAVLTLLFCVMSAEAFAWPLLYPMLVFPLSLVLLPPIAIGFSSRIPLGLEIRRWAIISCVVLSAALLLLGQHSFQAHVACRWSGA